MTEWPHDFWAARPPVWTLVLYLEKVGVGERQWLWPVSITDPRGLVKAQTPGVSDSGGLGQGQDEAVTSLGATGFESRCLEL